ncbi:TPA: hypothetical protein DIC40_08365 [Patescibacteria group bacterium]|nr:hypothetical protein [Candidatus Gracilibacteria bacterium]
MKLNYPKKFGLIRRRITPDAPKRAKATITFPISAFPLDAQLSSPPEAEIITQPANMPTNPIKIITVTNILVSPHISIGKAVLSVTLLSFASLDQSSVDHLDSSIQFPIKGTLVLSWIPQQTHVSVQGTHHFFSTALVQSGQINHLNQVSAVSKFLSSVVYVFGQYFVLSTFVAVF